MDTIPAESGSFFLADPGLPILKFAAARGPRASELLSSGLTVPVGQGIVGFCAQEGVSLTVNDMTKDPRYFAKVAEAISYQPQNTVVASVERDGRLYGAIQLINAKRSSGFDPGEAEVLRFLGLTAAQMLES